MISLDLDLSYLSSRYHITSSAIQLYQKKNMSITQIMETEAEKGNTAAADFLLKITSNPEELAKLFNLVDPKNRYLILSNMNKQDLMMIMEFLKPEELILGLSIFNQDMIVDMMMKIPPESLANVVLSKMDSNKFLESIPEKYMDEFIQSDKIDRNMLTEAMLNIEEGELQKMMEAHTGKACYDEKESIMKNINSMKDDEFSRAILSLEPEGKKQLISNLLSEKPDLFEEFSPEAMTHPFRTMAKEDVLKSLSVLETEEMLPMLEEMPQEIMALVATQINPEVFAQILCSEFSDVIAECGVF